jgi:hypothetical protein
MLQFILLHFIFILQAEVLVLNYYSAKVRALDIVHLNVGVG